MPLKTCNYWYLFYFILPAALQSVFPQTELGSFMALAKKDKERQLLELTLIVTGIRLFNKECGKGGEGIDDRKCFNELFIFISFVLPSESPIHVTSTLVLVYV